MLHIRRWDERDQLICHYFQKGYTYQEIVVTQLTVHGIKLCCRHLKSILVRLGLQRRVFCGEESNFDDKLH